MPSLRHKMVLKTPNISYMLIDFQNLWGIYAEEKYKVPTHFKQNQLVTVELLTNRNVFLTKQSDTTPPYFKPICLPLILKYLMYIANFRHFLSSSYHNNKINECRCNAGILVHNWYKVTSTLYIILNLNKCWVTLTVHSTNKCEFY